MVNHRRNAITAACLLGLVTIGTSAHAQTPPTAQTAQWAPNRLLVMPNAGLPATEFDKLLKPHGGKARRIGNSDLHIVDLPGQVPETAVLALLRNNPHLKFAELDQRVSPSLVANDPYNGSAWHLAKINASTAWDTAQGVGVTIAILDTGVDSTHPDLSARIVPGWNFFDNNSNSSDVMGHGTAVAGTAAASTNNGIGVASVAGAARIMPIRISDAAGYAYYSTIAQGITYAADKQVRVANVSFDGVARSASIISAAQYMKSKGGLVVVAAGNNSKDEAITPTTSMIAVSATDNYDAKASWSSYGSFVAVAAPGTTIWTTNRGGGYGQWQGTSFASPVAAGVVALMMSAKPTLPNAQIESLLYSTAVDLGAAGRDSYFGYGRVNAVAAVQAAASAVVTDTQAPSVAITAPTGGASVSGLTAVSVNASDNVGVSRVELLVNGTLLATDATSPYQFTWDTSTVASGMVNLVAKAFDAAGNSQSSTTVAVSVGIAADTTAPVVSITNPGAGVKVTGVVKVSMQASDNNGATGISQTLYIDGVSVASGTGASLSYKWNTLKAATGTHVLKVVAKDQANNVATQQIQVSK
jgi:thermitase